MKRRTFVAGLAAIAAASESVGTVQASSESGELVFHRHNMRLAIAMAKRNPKYPFGAVVVDSQSGDVLARGVNATHVNPLYHGEMVALNDYLAKYGNHGWSRTTLYTTAEPCAMCAGAIVWVGIPRVVYASSSRFVATVMDQITLPAKTVFGAARFYHNQLLLGGVLAAETDALFFASARRAGVDGKRSP
jgi:tRNA(adenine34) deaminase